MAREFLIHMTYLMNTCYVPEAYKKTLKQFYVLHEDLICYTYIQTLSPTPGSLGFEP